MGLSEHEIYLVRKHLDEAKKPLFFFHDDPDGVCSYLQFNAYVEGHGTIVKSRPIIDTKFLPKVESYEPDKIFVLDIAMMEQEFVDSVKVPIIWIDHHPPQKIHDVEYFNPRKHKNLSPCIADITYRIAGKNVWWAVVGSIGDMQWPKDLIREFRKKYPGLLPKDIKDPRTATYESDVGKLIRIFSFALKGTSSTALKNVGLLKKIEKPDEILSQTTKYGKKIFNNFKRINVEYEQLLARARKEAGKAKLLLFKYEDNSMAFSGDLANELAHFYPDKIILVGREKSGEVKCSFRSKNIVLPPRINKALEGLQGQGGGHDFASGANINADNFDEFVKKFSMLL